MKVQNYGRVITVKKQWAIEMWQTIKFHNHDYYETESRGKLSKSMKFVRGAAPQFIVFLLALMLIK